MIFNHTDEPNNALMMLFYNIAAFALCVSRVLYIRVAILNKNLGSFMYSSALLSSEKNRIAAF